MDEPIIKLNPEIRDETVFCVGTDIDELRVKILRDEAAGVWKESYKKAWKMIVGKCRNTIETTSYKAMCYHDRSAFLEAVLSEIEEFGNHMGEVFANGGRDDDE